MGMKNHEYRVNSLKKFFPEKKDELQYVRCYDFFFWDFFLMAKNRVREEYIVHTVRSIFETELFQKTLKSKERFGLRLLNVTDYKIEEFVNIAYNAFIDIKTYNKKLSMLKVFSALFGHFFFETLCGCDTRDILALSMNDFEDLSSAEGYYVNNLLNMYNRKQYEKKYSMLTFKRNIAIWRGEETK